MIDFKQIITDRHWELANEFDNLTEDHPDGESLLSRLAELEYLLSAVEAIEAAQSARRVVRGAGLHSVGEDK